jgi:hypothetical protein
VLRYTSSIAQNYCTCAMGASNALAELLAWKKERGAMRSISVSEIDKTLRLHHVEVVD